MPAIATADNPQPKKTIERRQIYFSITIRFWPISALCERRQWVDCGQSRPAAFDPLLPFAKDSNQLCTQPLSLKLLIASIPLLRASNSASSTDRSMHNIAYFKTYNSKLQDASEHSLCVEKAEDNEYLLSRRRYRYLCLASTSSLQDLGYHYPVMPTSLATYRSFR